MRFVPHFLLAGGLLCPIAGCTRATAPAAELGSADIDAIRATTETYRRAWLAGDAEGVLGTFTEDAVLLPHHGDPPITGKEAIRNYWFAPGPTTTITELTITITRVSGNATFAFVHGNDTVAWTTVQNGQPTRFSNAGTYLNVMQKSGKGWRIQAHMWDDPANQRQ
jgi:uncharacterized protein (TIGR02246 family)